MSILFWIILIIVSLFILGAGLGYLVSWLNEREK